MWPFLLGAGVVALAVLAMADDPDDVPTDSEGAGLGGIAGTGKPLRGAACITPEMLEQYPSLLPHVVRVDNPDAGTPRPGAVGGWEPVCYRLTEEGMQALLDLADEVGVEPRAWALALTDASFGRGAGQTGIALGTTPPTYTPETVEKARALLVAAGVAPDASVISADRAVRRRSTWLGILAGIAAYVSSATSSGTQSSFTETLGAVSSIVEVYASSWASSGVSAATLQEATKWALDNPPWVALSASAANRTREESI